MSSEIITVSNLSKSYLLFDSPRQRLWSLMTPGGDKIGKRFEALKPLSFTVKEGETLGIIGRNGSGKSTLLQCLAGTLTPSSGAVQVAQPLAALLELGAGFNPDFTGRENVFLNGAILGISREEMAARLEEILHFANIGEFIDRPLSTYSSGMVVRLAFAVATSVRPKVLIVDEALSVGDEAFQRKCFRRIEEMRAAGTSILFVSHSAQAVVQLCSRVLWLDAGEVLGDGDPKTITDIYHRYINLPQEQREVARAQILATGSFSGDSALQENAQGHEYGPDGARITDLRLTDLQGTPVVTLKTGQRYRLHYTVQCEVAASDLRCGMLLKTRTGVEVAGATLSISEAVQAGQNLAVQFDFTCHLAAGGYFLNCGLRAVVAGEDKYLHRRVDVLQLEVLPEPRAKGLLAGGVADLAWEAAVQNVTSSRSDA